MEPEKITKRDLEILFRNRARRLRRASMVTLIMVFLAICAGFLIFVFAQTIVENDFRLLQMQIKPPEYYLDKIEIPKIVPKDQLDAEKLKLQIKTDLLENEIVMLRKQNLFCQIMVSTLSTRIGCVILIIFLVQILVTTYRYQVKLSAFYEARADAIYLIEEIDNEKLERIAPILSPDHLDFGRSPQPPTSNVLDSYVSTLRIYLSHY
jgi:hypothetical protein